MTIPQASPVDLPSCTMVDEARLTSSSFKCPSRAIPEVKKKDIHQLENLKYLVF